LFVGLVGLGCKFALPAMAARYLHTCRSCRTARNRKRPLAANRCVATRDCCRAQAVSCRHSSVR
jgi:hypothetical protein